VETLPRGGCLDPRLLYNFTAPRFGVELPNTAVPKKNNVWAEMYHYFMYNREDFLAHYHKRSNVETAFSMIKAKFGDAVRSKSDIGQLNEVLCKVLCHNLCVIIQAIHELGIEATFETNHEKCVLRP
jgi:transposase